MDEVAELLELRLDRRISVNPRRTTRRAIAIDREVRVRELLTHLIELRKPASRTQLLRLAAANPCPPEQAVLSELAKRPEARALSVTECLAEFAATELSRAELLELFEPMAPAFSIASSARQVPREAELVVSVLEAPARSGYGVFLGCHPATSPMRYQDNRFRCASIPRAVRFAPSRAREERHPRRRRNWGRLPFRGFIGDRLAAQAAREPSHRHCVSSGYAILKSTTCSATNSRRPNARA